jgi:hypothetical protein
MLTLELQNHEIDLENDPMSSIVVPPLPMNKSEQFRRLTIKRKRDNGPNRLRRDVVVVNLPILVVIVPTTILITTIPPTPIAATATATATTTNIPENSSAPSPKNSSAIPSSIPTAMPTNVRRLNGGCVFRIPVRLRMGIWI